MPPCLMLKHPDPCHDTDTHTPVSTPPSPKLTCVLLMVYPCDCFVEVALCTPLFAEGLSAWAMNKMRTQHSQVVCIEVEEPVANQFIGVQRVAVMA